MKRCSSCKELKELDDFTRNKNCKDGLDNNCRKCKSIHSKKYRTSENGKKKKNDLGAKWKKTKKGEENNRRGAAKYQKTEKGKITRKKYYENHRQQNKDKKIAQSRIATEVRYGRLPRAKTLKCSYCPDRASHYHHHNGYSKEHWLDVVPICPKCHSSIHRRIH